MQQKRFFIRAPFIDLSQFGDVLAQAVELKGHSPTDIDYFKSRKELVYSITLYKVDV